MSAALRKFARGQECQVRIYGYCNHDPETTVWCHVRKGGTGGTGYKPPDICGLIACYQCHQVMDGHIKTEYTIVQIEAMMLHGMARTLALVDKNFELIERK